jgi:hypothetical protein
MCRGSVRLGSRWRPGAAQPVLEAARELDPGVEDESQLAGARLRGMVGAVHARRGPRWQLRGRSRREAASPAARTLPRHAASSTVRTDGPGLGSTRPRLAAASAFHPAFIPRNSGAFEAIMLHVVK